MDTYDNDLNPMEDFEDGEPEERRRRRDFVGTELERPKRGSRAQNKKRKRTGLTLMDDIEPSASNSTMETDFAPRTSEQEALFHSQQFATQFSSPNGLLSNSIHLFRM